METVSPFIEGTNIQYAWDSTSLGWAKTCPRLYYYNMVCGYRPKEESIHLRFGQEYHKSLEQYDHLRAEGTGHQSAQVSVVRNLLKRLVDYPEPRPDAKASILKKGRHNLIQAVIGYLDEFQNDPAQTHMKLDGKPAVELSFRFELDFGDDRPYMLCGHLDRIVNFNGDLFVMDRKTTSSTISSSYYWDQFHQNNQMTLYTIAGQIIMRSPIKGVIIDAVQLTTSEGPKYNRGFTFRTQDRIDEWMDDLKIHLHNFADYADAGYWPQNDTACDKFGGCQYRDVCSKSPNVRHHFLSSDFTQEDPWNPLAVR
jgi:hypothetical protein